MFYAECILTYKNVKKLKVLYIPQPAIKCSKLTTTKTPKLRHWRRSDVFIVITVNFEQVNANWNINLIHE